MLLGSAVSVTVGTEAGGGTSGAGSKPPPSTPPWQALPHTSNPRIATSSTKVRFLTGMIRSSLNMVRVLPSVSDPSLLKLCEAPWRAVAAATAVCRLNEYNDTHPKHTSTSPPGAQLRGRAQTPALGSLRSRRDRVAVSHFCRPCRGSIVFYALLTQI